MQQPAWSKNERSARAQTLGPLERACAIVNDAPACRAWAACVNAVLVQLDALEQHLQSIEPPDGPRPATTPSSADAPRADDASVAFDSDTYDRALRPERYRVVLLGALRRGKSSLINAIAGSAFCRTTQREKCSIPCMFGMAAPNGRMHSSQTAAGRRSLWGKRSSRRSRCPVLIEVPWTMPHELVIVHAAGVRFGHAASRIDRGGGGPQCERSGGLFSRQLSDRELALYERVADFEKPMLLAHTIADNESSAQRRTVVELANRYVRERRIPAARIFTISAIDYLDAMQSGRPAAPWNEFGALRDTLQAHAEEHMRRAQARRPPSARHAARRSG